MTPRDSRAVTGPETQASPRISTGTEGLDAILFGGLPAKRMYLLQGDPGVGKTTMAVRFLLEGTRQGESCLYITLSETTEELRAVARSHGWSLDNLTVHEMSASEANYGEPEENTLYVPAEVELGERITALLEVVDRVKPTRVVIDSCSELRLLAQSPLRFRRQVLALKERLVQRDCTVLLLENPVTAGGDTLLQSLVHGVVVMEQLSPLYGAERRRLRIVKMREVSFRGGYHDMVIRRGGVEVFPRLIASEHDGQFARSSVSSGVEGLDALLDGGLDRGTSALLMGPAGSGKSAIATRYVCAAAERGEKAVIFSFDEGTEILLSRAEKLGMPLRRHIDEGSVRVQQIDPAELSPGEFTSVVRDSVDRLGARVVVIDSLNGYLHSMPEERFLTAHLHELLAYLRRRGVLTVLVMVQHGFVGRMEGPIDVSYVADTVVLTRYFEAGGRVRKAISVVKKRSGRHEDTIREFSVGQGGIIVGPPLTDFHGVLTGVPEFEGRGFGTLLDQVDPGGIVP
ncbi:MAG: circadian clock protein KaiC [Myxococcaceae bacterium]|nr:circadian clock protein KaiC [Myxococcaceae bacterium]